MKHRYVVTFSLAALLAGAGIARADGGNARAAERLFLEGRDLDGKGRFAEACTRYEQSETLDPAVGTLLNLGTCAERQGRTATALHRYREAAALASRHADARREALANRAAEGLAARQSSLVVHAHGPLPPGTVVHRNDDAVAPSELGNPVEVDPGTYIVRVESPGQPTWSRTVTVGPGPVVVRVDLPEATDTTSRPAASPPPVVAPPPAPTITATNDVADPATASTPSTRTALTPVAIAAGVAGVAALAVGGYFGLHARSQWNTVTQTCPSGHCKTGAVESSEQGLDDSAERNGNIGTGLLVGGGVALAAGVVLFLVDGRARSQLEISASSGGAVARFGF
jgi:hypothetical protein